MTRMAENLLSMVEEVLITYSRILTLVLLMISLKCSLVVVTHLHALTMMPFSVLKQTEAEIWKKISLEEVKKKRKVTKMNQNNQKWLVKEQL